MVEKLEFKTVGKNVLSWKDFHCSALFENKRTGTASTPSIAVTAEKREVLKKVVIFPDFCH